MNKHKKRISLITLTVFVLLTALSGAAMAAKAPVEKGRVATPAMNGGSGSTGAGESEHVTNVGYTGQLRLTDLRVSGMSIVQTNDSSLGFDCDVYDYTVTGYAGSPDSIEVTADREAWKSDFTGISYCGETRYTEAFQGSIDTEPYRPFTEIFTINYDNPNGNIIEVFVGEFNNEQAEAERDYQDARIGETYIIRILPQLESISLSSLSGEPVKIDLGDVWGVGVLQIYPNPSNAYIPAEAQYIWHVEPDEGTETVVYIEDVGMYEGNYTGIVWGTNIGKANVYATVTIDDVVYTTNKIQVIVSDSRTIQVDPHDMTLKKKRDPGTITANINWPIYDDSNANKAFQGIANSMSIDIQNTKNGTYIKNEDDGVDWYNYGVTWSTDRPDLVDLDTSGDFNKICKVIPKNKGSATVTATLANGESDSCVVQIKSTKKRVIEDEPTPAPAALPELLAAPEIETLEVTITVGSNQAIVNGEQLTLAGNTLLIGEDRAMVDYADIAKLIPGVEVVWDWKALSVTFTKDGKVLTMVLDQVPADFDTPFMNLEGRMVVPVRYVGNFFGASVDWIGDTLVVHIYK